MKMDKERKIEIMGIVNITDNSYFASSRCLGQDGSADMEKVLGRVSRMLEEGADFIDIGACSTRPGSDPVGEHEEWKRLEPVASVVEKAADLIGPFIVNDISAGEDDPKMLPTVGRLGLKYIAMHKRGTPKTMQSLCEYGNVTEDVLQYFREFGEKAAKAGIEDWILDPGFGFAKTVEQNWQMLRELDRFLTLGHEILVGVSRKSMIYRLFDITPEESLPQTQVLHLAALQKGASILRVHDVAEARRTVTAWRLLQK